MASESVSNNNTVKYSNLELTLNEIGDFGRFQIQNLLLICFATFCIGVCGLSYIFAAGDLNYRCFVPGCDDNITEYRTKWLKYAVPFEHDEPEKCQYYVNVNNTCAENSFDKSVIKTCTNFVYETNEKTILNEWNLTCPDNKWKLTFVGTVTSIGIIFGTPISGYCSDKYGRRMIFALGMVICGTFGVLKSLSWNYISFLVFEFLEPFFGAGVYGCAFILGIEFVGTKYRLTCSTIISCSYALGVVVMGFVAMMTQEWRLYVQIMYAPAILFITYIWIIPESIRWLHSADRAGEVVNLLKKAAATNNVILSEEALKSLDSYKILVDLNSKSTRKISIQDLPHEDNNKYNLFEMFRFPKIVVRLCVCGFVWMANSFIFYGLSLNAVSIGGDKYTSFMLVSLIEIPGYFFCWIFADKIGRRLTLTGTLFLNGLFCLLSPLMEDIYFLKLTFYLIGKLAITIAYSTIYVYTMEMFPTNLRHSLFGVSASLGKLGGMFAPQTPLLEFIMKSLPMIVFGAVAIVAGLASLSFPETLNKDLPETLEEAVEIGQKKQIKIKLVPLKI